jgi:hypothetical protein
MINNSALSPIVFSQFPQNIRENYPVFMQFIADYYAFMEQNYNSPTNVIQNLRDLIDIDNTTDQFLTLFPRAYQNHIPQIVAVDRRLLSKAMVEVYQTKGSLTSFQLLFRLIYNVDIEITYPKTQMLRTSDGKWIQLSSIRVNVTNGNINQIIGRIVSTNNSTGNVTASVTNYSLISGSLYEVFFENIAPGTTFFIGDTVSFNGTNVTGTLMATIVSYTIVNAGTGFTPGQIFNVNTSSGNGASFKVTTTNSAGGIVTLTPLTFGNGYKTNYFATLYPYTTQLGVPSTYNDFTGGFICDGTLTNSSGKVLQTFHDDASHAPGKQYVDSSAAKVLMILGAVSNYAGYYSASDGFLSDEIVLQDGVFYQDFSYLIKSVLPVNQYRNTVQKILHPAGTKMFGEYQLGQDLNIVVSQSGDAPNLSNLDFNDFVIPVDSISLYETPATVSDSVILNTDHGSILQVNYMDVTYVDVTYVGTLTTF